MIGGFTIDDPHGFERSARLLIRAIGPELRKFDIKSALSNPVLNIFNAAGDPIANNVRWGDDAKAATIRDVCATTGAFPLSEDGNDAATLVTIPAGSYTVHVKGVNGETGTVLLGIYLVEE